MNKIQDNSTVSLHYQLSLEDGTEVENSFDAEPLVFTLGDGTLTEGMELALLGLTENESISVTIAPEQAYGYPDENKIHSMPLNDFPDDLQPEPGQVIAFDGPDDEEIIGTILEINGDEVTVDFSHPLAGRTLIFKANTLEVTSAAN
ncbi:MAG: peptidylprolyl isomerase [Gammaproteobacteria bacterium]|nr:peptidylprolyl isomerase [Gammaproteobacteria bacterium]